jgi:hypothetical protein
MNKFQTALAAAGLALASSGASAAIVTLEGATVTYSYDDTAFLNPLFGSFKIATDQGLLTDTLTYDPTTFVAEKDSKGIDLTTATTPVFTVKAKAGYALTELDLFEQGDYLRVEDAANNTVVSVAGQFIVNDVPQSITSTEALDGAILVSDLQNGGTLATSPWTVENYAYLDFTESATVKVQNILFAMVTTDSGLNSAFIEKKLVNITAWTTPVPVPGAFWLFGSALTGVLVSRRRVAA